MAALDQALKESDLVRILAYGASKMRKTWFACKAAELGFNVILCDIDYGFHVAKNLTPEARKRIFHVDMRGPVDGYKNCGAMTLAWAMTGQVTLYDETERKYARRTGLDPDKKYVKFDFSKATSRDILIIDSWTQFSQHLVLADRNVMDPTQVPKLEWDDYQKQRLALDHFISNMARLNCHLIVIGHAEEWAKRRADAPQKAKPEEAIEAIRTQPMSVSRSHAATLAKNFTDVLYFMAPNPLIGVQISTKGSDDFDAGSRTLPPGLKKWDDVSIANFLPQAMVDAVATNSQYSSEAVVEINGSDMVAAAQANAHINVDSKKPSTILNNLKGNSK